VLRCVALLGPGLPEVPAAFAAAAQVRACVRACVRARVGSTNIRCGLLRGADVMVQLRGQRDGMISSSSFFNSAQAGLWAA
jgi:hypothetical protein